MVETINQSINTISILPHHIIIYMPTFCKELLDYIINIELIFEDEQKL